MTPDTRRRIRELGLNSRSFAAIVGMDEDTVSGWGRKHRRKRAIQREPIWARHLVRDWERCPALLREAVAEAHRETGN